MACVIIVTPLSNLCASQDLRLSQQIISYGFLRSNYSDFDQMLQSNLAVAKDMKALQNALDSLHCDVPSLLAFTHRSFVLPASPQGQWIRSAMPTESMLQEESLFVTEPLSATPQRVFVVLSSGAPERTTAFWVEEKDGGYAARLVYDTFNKASIRNAPQLAIGVVVGVRLESDHEFLLEQRADLGSRPSIPGALGGVFRVDLSSGVVTQKSPGKLPQH